MIKRGKNGRKSKKKEGDLKRQFVKPWTQEGERDRQTDRDRDREMDRERCKEGLCRIDRKRESIYMYIYNI